MLDLSRRPKEEDLSEAEKKIISRNLEAAKRRELLRRPGGV